MADLILSICFLFLFLSTPLLLVLSIAALIERHVK